MLRVSLCAAIASASLIGLVVGAAPASAISDRDACEAQDGTYVKDGGTATCKFPVGSSDNTKDVSQKGSFGSSHDESLTNPGGNQPPGQQGGNRLE
jgi:hypothetical protein